MHVNVSFFEALGFDAEVLGAVLDDRQRGLVLPVGGIKEKVLAAHRAGIKRVLLPARNRKDFEEIPESARDALEFVWLENVDDAIRTALGDEGCADEEARLTEPASV